MSKTSPPVSVSIIVPTYNERDNIAPLVERIHRTLHDDHHEIVFVDDDSRDGTADVAKSLMDKFPVKVFVRKNERGLSSAVVYGLKQATSDFVVVMDADLQHPPETLAPMLAALQKNDLVVASRYTKGGSPGNWPLTRRIISFVANLIALPLAPRVKDRMSGFFGFRRTSVNAEKLNALGWKIGLEIMVRGNQRSVSEVPYTFERRVHGSSKLSRNIIFQYLRQAISLYFHKYRIINFMMVGGIGYVINISLYSALTLIPALKSYEFNQVGETYYVPPFVLSSLVAIVSNYLMNRAWTFRSWTEHRAGFGRYMLMAIVTLVLDTGLLFAFVEKGNLPPQPAAALAILIVFVARYLIARSWVWSQKSRD